MKPMRLQKFLSAAGVCSRRKGETFILAGRVTVNGERITTLGTRVDPETDRVLVDVTQQTVRPVSDSSDWYFWASWVRFWVEQEGRCWRVASSEIKGTV